MQFSAAINCEYNFNLCGIFESMRKKEKSISDLTDHQFHCWEIPFATIHTVGEISPCVKHNQYLLFCGRG